jgi:hypothetical protein
VSNNKSNGPSDDDLAGLPDCPPAGKKDPILLELELAVARSRYLFAELLLHRVCRCSAKDLFLYSMTLSGDQSQLDGYWEELARNPAKPSQSGGAQ